MKVLINFFTLLSPLLQRLGSCAAAGFIAGAFAGFVLSLQALVHAPPATLTNLELVKVSLLLAIGGWLIIVFAFVALGRVSFSDVWHSSFFNAFLTCLLTVVLVHNFHLWRVALLLGMMIGVLVGSALCHLNRILGKEA